MTNKRNKVNNEPAKLQMTSMIDVVFLLLSFFIITFKVVDQEGELGVKMPLTGAQPLVAASVENEPVEPLRVRLLANNDGSLRDIQIGSERLGPNPELLQAYVRKYVGDPIDSEKSDKLEAELDCDQNLDYQHTITAMTKIRGYLSNNQVIPLIKNIKFASRK